MSVHINIKNVSRIIAWIIRLFYIVLSSLDDSQPSYFSTHAKEKATWAKRAWERSTREWGAGRPIPYLVKPPVLRWRPVLSRFYPRVDGMKIRRKSRGVNSLSRLDISLNVSKLYLAYSSVWAHEVSKFTVPTLHELSFMSLFKTTVNCQYSGHPRDHYLVSLIARGHNSEVW